MLLFLQMDPVNSHGFFFRRFDLRGPPTFKLEMKQQKLQKEKFPHLKVTESAQAQHTRITLNWERDRVPQKGRNRHGKDGKLGLTLCSGFSSSSTNYTSYQGVSGQHILRKDVAGIHTKDIGHTWSM